MIRKLRIKLTAASMLSLFLVLAVILSVTGILNYRGLVSDADSILEILSENDGNFPKQEHMRDDTGAPSVQPKDGRFSPELPYESRYFSVTFSDETTVSSVNTGKIAAVDSSTAIDLAESVISGKNQSGFIHDYRYCISEEGSARTVIFLDCGRELGSFRTFIFTVVSVSCMGMLAVLLLISFLSGRIVKPFSENYEKQKQFITDAGHELKTPLTVIDADAEILEMDFGESEWLNDIRNQTKRLAELTNSMIFLARMEESHPKTEMIEFPFSDVTEDTVSAFRSVAKTHNRTLTDDIQPMLSFVGDEKAIRRLISILLDNAIKYSDENGQISLTLSRQKSSIRLCVFNTAESVSAESLPHFFDRFYRADPSRSSEINGYGLGLSIALAIVKAHKGKISASTEDGKSVQITVIFPL